MGLSHVDPNMVTGILEEIKKHFGDIIVSRGDIRDFLGVTVKISHYNKV